MFYEAVFRALQTHKVQYAVAGGVALNLHGIPRMTADLDLIVLLESNNLKQFLIAMSELGYHPRLPVAPEELLSPDNRTKWIHEKGLHAFTFWNACKPFEEVDILIGIPAMEDLFKHAKTFHVDELTIPVVSIKDLICLKKVAGREQDKMDIEALAKLQKLGE